MAECEMPLVPIVVGVIAANRPSRETGLTNSTYPSNANGGAGGRAVSGLTP